MIGISKPITNLEPLNHIREFAIILLDLLLQVHAQEDLFDAAVFLALRHCPLDQRLAREFDHDYIPLFIALLYFLLM